MKFWPRATGAARDTQHAEAQPNPSALYRERTGEELELERLQRHLAAIRCTLVDRELDLSDLRARLQNFEARYLREVGLLCRKLDDWNQRVADIQGKPRDFVADDVEVNDEGDTEANHSALETGSVDADSLLDLKALFREVAKRLHPDFAADRADERRRTRLMAQANAAYLREDRSSLERMLHGADAPHEETSTKPIAQQLVEAKRRTVRVERDIVKANAEITALETSDLGALHQRSIEAALAGRDLLAEMASRVKGSIGLAMRQYELDLDRIRRPPAGPRVETLLSAETTVLFSGGRRRR